MMRRSKPTQSEELVKVRHTTHGDVQEQFECAQAIKAAMRSARGWNNLPSFVKEGLEMDAVKTSRIINGDYTHIDHWDDKQGYAQCVKEVMGATPQKTL